MKNFLFNCGVIALAAIALIPTLLWVAGVALYNGSLMVLYLFKKAYLK